MEKNNNLSESIFEVKENIIDSYLDLKPFIFVKK